MRKLSDHFARLSSGAEPCPERRQDGAQPDERGAGVRDLSRERRQLLGVDLGRSGFGEDGADPPLEARALRLELEDAGVPGRKRGLEVARDGRSLARDRCIEQVADLLEESRQVIVSVRRHVGDYPRLGAEPQWAERPIFGAPNSQRRRGRPARATVLAAALAAVVAASVAVPVAAAPERGGVLARRLANALAVPQVDRRQTAALAVELSSGKVVYGRNGWRPLVPASNAKLPVAYAALARLGPSYRIATNAMSVATLRGATLRGPIVLQGHGDPTLARTDLHTLARRLRARGIRRITGPVIGDESFFDSRRTAPGWKSWFYVNECEPLSALSVDRGRYGGQLSRNPPLAAALAFRRALRVAGIAAPGRAAVGRASPHAVPLASISSPPLGRIVRLMGSDSDNFTAELVLKQLGAVEHRRGTTVAGARVVHQTLADAGVPLAGVRIADGSGLSPQNRLSARAVVGILRAAWTDPALRTTFVRSLAVAGKTGTLDDRLERPPARGNVYAKTGTTYGSSALSGFVRGRYAFAVIQNGSPVASWWARLAQDRFVGVLLRAQ